MYSKRGSAKARRRLPDIIRPARHRGRFRFRTAIGKQFQSHAFNIVAATSLVLFAITTIVVVRTVSEAQNRVYFRNIAESALQRSERIVDDVSVTLAGLVQRSAVECNEMTLSLFQAEARLHAAVSDFRIVDGQGKTLCSSNPVAQPSLRNDIDLAAGLHSHDGQIRLFAIRQTKVQALGVFRSLDAKNSIVAVVHTERLSENLPPVSLKNGYEARVRLNDGVVIASYIGGSEPVLGNSTANRRPIAFRAASRRYPLQAEISVDGALLTEWASDVRSAYPVRAGL